MPLSERSTIHDAAASQVDPLEYTRTLARDAVTGRGWKKNSDLSGSLARRANRCPNRALCLRVRAARVEGSGELAADVFAVERAVELDAGSGISRQFRSTRAGRSERCDSKDATARGDE